MALLRCRLQLIERDDHRLLALQDGVFGDDHLLHVPTAGDLIHDIQHDLFDNRAESARAGLALERLPCDGGQGVLGEDQIDIAIQLKEALILFDQGVLRLDQDPDQRLLIQRVQRRDDRQAADELWNEAILQQVLRQRVGEEGALRRLLLRVDGAKAHATTAEPSLNQLIQPRKRSAADEEDIGGVDLHVFLLGVLATSLQRDVGDSAFQDLQERLLHALARHIPRDRRVVRLAGDLVDLVDVDDPPLGVLDGGLEAAALGGLNEAQEDILHILADVAGLRERG